jgi:hypothetical protein
MRIWISLFIASLAWLPAAAQAEERIRAMHADIVVDRTGVVHVTEAIEIVAEGMRFKHGITRDFPLEVMTDAGLQPIKLEVLSAERDGEAEEVARKAVPGGVRVRIGDSGSRLEPGNHSYRLTYTIDNQILPAGEDDMFAWSVTGQWKVPIEEASATVRLPNGVRVLGLQFHAGAPESEEPNVDAREKSGALEFVSTRPLEPDEQLSLKIRIPRNAIAVPYRD